MIPTDPLNQRRPTRYNLQERLRRLRRALGITVPELGKAIGVSHRTFGNWREGDKPLLESLQKIHALEMRVGTIGPFRKASANARTNSVKTATLIAAKPFLCGVMTTRNSAGVSRNDLPRPHPCTIRVAHAGEKCSYHQPGGRAAAHWAKAQAGKEAAKIKQEANKAEVEAILAATEARKKALADQRWATRRKNYPKLEAVNENNSTQPSV